MGRRRGPGARHRRPLAIGRSLYHAHGRRRGARLALYPARLPARCARPRRRLAARDPLASHPRGAGTTALWDKRSPYTAEEVEALIRVSGPEERVLVQFGAHAGLRGAEALALTSGDVSTGAGSSGGALIVRHGKGGKQRRVPVSPSRAAAITALQAAPGPVTRAPIAALSPRAGGTALPGTTAVGRRCAQSGLPRAAACLRDMADASHRRPGGGRPRAGTRLDRDEVHLRQVGRRSSRRRRQLVAAMSCRVAQHSPASATARPTRIAFVRYVWFKERALLK